MNPIQKTAKVGGKEILLETGKIAKQAHGSVWVRQGDSIVLVTVVSAAEKKEGIDFFPLTVDYREKLPSAGKFPGGFKKREGPPSEKEILTMRAIDRPIRPLFPDGFLDEVQIQCFVLSHDGENDTDVLAGTAASAALALSDVPFEGPTATVRVGRVHTDSGPQMVVNPTVSQLEFIRDSLPPGLLRSAELRGRYIQFAKAGEAEKRITQEPLNTLENGLKVRRKMLDALHDDGLLALKRRQEAELKAKIAATPSLAGLGDPWGDIARATALIEPMASA